MLIFKDDYIVTIPAYKKTEMHIHPMLHLIVSESPVSLNTGEQQSSEHNIVIIEGNIRHKIEIYHKESLVILIDSSSSLAEGLRQQWLSGQSVCLLSQPLGLLLGNKSEDDIVLLVESIFQELKVNRVRQQEDDKRISELVDEIHSGKRLDMNVSDIAYSMALSVSRLEHLFKDLTGMRLKNCLLMGKLRVAYQLTLQGKSITEAAMSAGFSDSAHLAATAKKTTGISISNFHHSRKTAGF